MTDEMLIERFLEPYRDDLVGLVKAVAAIPWGEGRTIEEVLQSKRVGTCTGKHAVLQRCLDVLHIPYRTVVSTFHWSAQSLLIPDHLRVILAEGEWEHGHNFIQLKHGDAWIDVDVIWDPLLAQFGFRSFPADWDGTTSFCGIWPMVRRWDGASIMEKKKELIDALPLDMRERRERFLHGFIEWIGSLRTLK